MSVLICSQPGSPAGCEKETSISPRRSWSSWVGVSAACNSPLRTKVRFSISLSCPKAASRDSNQLRSCRFTRATASSGTSSRRGFPPSLAPSNFCCVARISSSPVPCAPAANSNANNRNFTGNGGQISFGSQVAVMLQASIPDPAALDRGRDSKLFRPSQETPAGQVFTDCSPPHVASITPASGVDSYE